MITTLLKLSLEVLTDCSFDLLSLFPSALLHHPFNFHMLSLLLLAFFSSGLLYLLLLVDTTTPQLSKRQDCLQISVIFNVNATTHWGESIHLIGSIPELGSWNLSGAIPLSAVDYTADTPIWSASVNLPLSTSFDYKFIKLGTDASVAWEPDPNRQYRTPLDCHTSPVIATYWQLTSSPTPPQVSASAGAVSTPSACFNGPDSRHCWTDGFDINTDFDNRWPSTGRKVSYVFEITNTTLAPDGYSRTVFAINGQYPGPTIYADWGDTIEITVMNKLQYNGTTLHFHGLRQWHSNLQDGVPGLTECPLAPGRSRMYSFIATQYGTSWYHSHFSCQYGDGVLGPIVINGPASANYDIDLGPLTITDWYYPTVMVSSARTQHVNGPPPTADNGLINGTMVSNSGGAYGRTILQPGKHHLLRLINTSVDNHFMVSIDGHQLLIIAADFVPIQPYNTTWLFVGIGQRYDVIIVANQSPKSYWLRAEVQSDCGANFNNGNIKSIVSYAGYKSSVPSTSATSYQSRCLDEQQIVPHWNSYVPSNDGFAMPTFLGTAINQSYASDGTMTIYWQVNGSALNVDWNNPTIELVESGDSAVLTSPSIVQIPLERRVSYRRCVHARDY